MVTWEALCSVNTEVTYWYHLIYHVDKSIDCRNVSNNVSDAINRHLSLCGTDKINDQFSFKFSSWINWNKYGMEAHGKFLYESQLPASISPFLLQCHVNSLQMFLTMRKEAFKFPSKTTRVGVGGFNSTSLTFGSFLMSSFVPARVVTVKSPVRLFKGSRPAKIWFFKTWTVNFWNRKTKNIYISLKQPIENKLQPCVTFTLQS